jgi:hypothetical protein
MTTQEQIKMLRDVLEEICTMQAENLGSGIDTHIDLMGLAEKARAALAATSLPAQPVAEGYEELARLAMAATPGKRKLCAVIDRSIKHLCLVDDDGLSMLTVVHDEGVPFAAVYKDEDAKFLAACDAATILALIEANAHNTQLAERVAVLEAAQVPEGMVIAPHYRGYANLGTGQYVLNHSKAGEPMEFVISVATEAEKAGRVVGDERDNEPDALLQPEAMAVRIAFASLAGLEALENQIRKMKLEHGVTTPQPHADEAAKGGWQPMSTAPLDGTQVIVRYPSQGNVKRLASYQKLHKFWVSNGEPFWPVQQGCEWAAIPVDSAPPSPAEDKT